MSEETTPEQENAWGEWGGEDVGTPATVASFVAEGVPMPAIPPSNSITNLGELKPQRENHAFTLSLQAGRDAPMLVLRAESAAELNNLITQVEMSGLWANVGNHLSTMRAQGTLGAGMGPVQAVPQAAPQPQVTPQGIPMMPQAQFGPPLGAGGAPGTAPAPWQNAGAPGGAPAGCSGVPQGWYKVNIPYQSKAAGDAIKNNLKAQNLYQGNVNWCAGAKHWHVSPNVAGAFAQFGPTQ